MYGKHLLKRLAGSLASPFLSSETRKQLFSRKQTNRIASADFPSLSFFGESYCGAIMIFYSAIFICAWPFYFPTPAERILWRTASIVTLGFSFLLGLGLMYFDYIYFGRSRFSRREPHDGGFWNWACKVLKWQIASPRRTARAAAMRHHLSEKPWLYYLPKAGRVWILTMMVFYCIARLYILTEDLIGLRSLPSSAFETVEWTQYLPQI